MPGSALMALSQPEKDVTDPLTGLLWSGGGGASGTSDQVWRKQIVMKDRPVQGVNRT